ncbi:hypothetical protein [Thermoplasma volcanium GSS1]|uniref:HPP transmembrane region domain-containing protein n=1 Tax=Thermoplasma volcanium (strain ATCC 51530 / DSM 4299 / JCM 9571 / NBRC 15438 / GSS1) TaxID=273116 RepID=Q97C52_THEVO|nr:HPP family protein [Thermoplasma volcanium]BAB59395.1 hypothetical protein [Thermoplasma volcanium GSS1]
MNRWKNILSFLAIFGIIIVWTYVFRLALLAPPFAVSAYLISVEHRGRFSKPDSLIVSYVAVILSTTLLHILLGTGVIQLYLNVVIISILITFTRFKHPPAIALAVFSYIEHNDVKFVESSIIILIVLWLADLIHHHYVFLADESEDKEGK